MRQATLPDEAEGDSPQPRHLRHEERGYLTYDTSPPERAARHGGFDLILSQLRRFELALKVAVLANRTLILPRLRCGNRAMAYPCYAWYHRAMTSGGMRHDRVPMPEYCPYAAHPRFLPPLPRLLLSLRQHRLPRQLFHQLLFQLKEKLPSRRGHHCH